MRIILAIALLGASLSLAAAFTTIKRSTRIRCRPQRIHRLSNHARQQSGWEGVETGLLRCVQCDNI